MAKRKSDDDGTASAAAPAADATVQRLSIQLDDKGGIAWDRMRSGTRDQLRSALASSNVGQNLGVDAATIDTGFDPTMIGIAYDALNSLMIGLARRQGYTAEQSQVLAFTSAEKEALAPLTAKVANKWIPVGKYQEELMLALMITTTIAGKLTLLRRSAQVIQMAKRADQQGQESTQAPV